MLEEEKSVSVIDYLEIAWRRKWFIILPFPVVIPIAIALCFMLPKIYKASSTIMVIPKIAPDSFVQSTLSISISEYLNVVSQQIKSRTRIEKIIHELSLFPELIEKVPMENLVHLMQENIEISVSSSGNTGFATFTVFYLDKDPQIVASTANRLVSLFIEDQLQIREKQAMKTTEFLSDELKELKVTLDAQEKKISDFKHRYLESLPEYRDSNLRMLDQLILQRQRITGDLNDIENRKILLQQQLLQSDNLPLSPVSDEQRGVPIGPLRARINETKRRLTELQNKYTNEHPDVILAKAELQKLLAQPKSESKNTEGQEEADTFFGSEIDRQLLALDLEIKTLKNEDKMIRKKIVDYQSRVEKAPKLEQQLASLTRDYQNTKSAYDVIMKKRFAAKQAEKFEANEQGDQFRVIDPAQVPVNPFKPDRRLILLMGVMIALGLGGGLTFAMEYLDQSFYSVKDLESYLGLPVLASIPLVPSSKG